MTTTIELTWIASSRQWRKRRYVNGKQKDFYLANGTGKDIRRWTDTWFDHSTREERYRFIEQEIQRRWRDMMNKLDAQLDSVEPGEEAVAA